MPFLVLLGAWEEGTGHVRVSPNGIFGVYSLLPFRGKLQPSHAEALLAHRTRWLSSISQTALPVRKEKFVFPLSETCFHTSVGSEFRQKTEEYCF